jgi:hypothetical protein
VVQGGEQPIHRGLFSVSLFLSPFPKTKIIVVVINKLAHDHVVSHVGFSIPLFSCTTYAAFDLCEVPEEFVRQVQKNPFIDYYY